jgi:flagellar basal-body rod protein FlgB
MIDSTTKLLERVLDMRMQSHQVHTSNIANANVPHYKAKKVEFDQAVHEALQNAERKDIERAYEQELDKAVQEIKADVYEDPLAIMNGNGNTVNMEREQTDLAKNTIAYEAAINLVNKRLAMQKYVFGDGGR